MRGHLPSHFIFTCTLFAMPDMDDFFVTLPAVMAVMFAAFPVFVSIHGYISFNASCKPASSASS